MPITKEDGVIVGLVFLSLFALIVGIGLCICFCGGKGVLNRCVPNQFRLDADATDSALPDGRGRTVMVGGGVEVGDFTGKAGVGAGGGDNMDEWVRYVTVKEMYEKSSEGSMSPQALKQWLAEAKKRKKQKVKARERLAAGGEAVIVPLKPPVKPSSRVSGGDEGFKRHDPLKAHMAAARAQYPLVGLQRPAHKAHRHKHAKHHSSWEPAEK